MNVVLDRRITIEQPVSTSDGTFGTPVITWAPLAVVWAEVQDAIPSRSESVKMGLAVALNNVRVRYRYRTDVNSSMRIRISGPVERVLNIIAGPAELGRHEYSEVVCESVSS